MPQGSLDPKIRSKGVLCSPRTDRQTHTHTDRHESEYRRYPSRVSEFFPSPYHQGSVQDGGLLKFGFLKDSIPILATTTTKNEKNPCHPKTELPLRVIYSNNHCQILFMLCMGKWVLHQYHFVVKNIRLVVNQRLFVQPWTPILWLDKSVT